MFGSVQDISFIGIIITSGYKMNSGYKMKYDFPFDTDEQIGDFIRNVKEQMKNWSDIIDLVVLDMLNNLRFDLENDTFYISIYDHKIKLGHVTYHDNYHISVSDDLDFLGNDEKICKILNNNY